MTTFPIVRYTNALALLQYRAENTIGTAFSFMREGEIDAAVTFAELDNRARGIAAHLQSTVAPGERALIICPPGLDYIAAFFGCIYAGVIAVPAIPPANIRALPRLQAIVDDAKPRIALTTAATAQQIGKFQTSGVGTSEKMLWLNVDDLVHLSTSWRMPILEADDLAFLQYTSGSTGTPKGVMISHRNLFANVAAIHDTVGLTETDTVVSWLPMYHDMGLIGKILYPLYAGCHCIHFSPTDFLKRPYRWLKTLSEYRARTTSAPNFAYDLCAQKITDAQKETLDLSALEFALNGAEPVKAATLRRFADAFSGCGFQRKALMPVYGLAESTLIVSANLHKNPDGQPRSLAISKTAFGLDRICPTDDVQDAIELVAVGSLASDQREIVIVDPLSLLPQPDDRVGEIWISSPSVAQGYWSRATESALTFAARLPGRSDQFLRTGDFGFIHEQTLYVAGRRKDMMIFNGSNLYPQDIEVTVEACDPAFRVGGCAAFALEVDDVLQLVIVQEVENRQQPVLDDLATRLRADIVERHGVSDVYALMLVKAGSIPRTSSGKLQRSRCRELFVAGELTPLWSWCNEPQPKQQQAYVAPCTATERKLASLWEDLFDIENVSAHADFFQLGGHSLIAMQLANQSQTTFKITLPFNVLFEAPVLHQLAAAIDRHIAEYADASDEQLPACAPDEARHYDHFLLGDTQQAYWNGRSSSENIMEEIIL